MIDFDITDIVTWPYLLTREASPTFVARGDALYQAAGGRKRLAERVR